MTPKAGLYVRVSDPEQVEGYSIEAQLAAGRERAASEGWELQEYVEPGRSARTDERPVYQTWLADLEAGHLDIAMVHKLDRMSRSVLDILTAFRDWERWNVQFVSLTESFDFTTPIGRVVLTILATFAQWYLDNLSQETRKGMKQKVVDGGWPWRAPLGYVNRQNDGRSYVDVCPVLGPLITRGFQTIASGKTLDEWTELASREGYRTRRGHKIHKSVWARIFRNRFYLGLTYYRSDGIEVEGNHPALTDPETFGKVQTMLDERGGEARKGHTWRKYLLQGLLWSLDAECKFYSESHPSKGLSYYKTKRKLNGQHLHIPCQVLEDQIPALLRQVRLKTKTGLTLPKGQRELALALKVAPNMGSVYVELSSFDERRRFVRLVFSQIAVAGTRLVCDGSTLKEPFSWIVRENLAPGVGLEPTT